MPRQPANRANKTNYEDYLIDFSNYKPIRKEPEQDPGYWNKVWDSGATVLEGLTLLPEEIWNVAKDTYYGGNIDVTDRERIDDWRRHQEKIQAFEREHEGRGFEGVAGAMGSAGYSLATLGPVLAGMAMNHVSAGLGTAVGMAGSGAIAYRATKEDFMQRLLQATEEQLGRQATPEEWQRVATRFNDEATKYGIWEAAPEAIGNALFARLLKPLGASGLGDGIKKLAMRYLGAQAEEQLTETATQYGQGGLDAKMGFREKAPTIPEAFLEQAPTTFWLTNLMMGGHKAASFGYNQAKKRLAKKADETAANAENPSSGITGQTDKAVADTGQQEPLALPPGKEWTGLGPIALGEGPTQQQRMDNGEQVDLLEDAANAELAKYDPARVAHYQQYFEGQDLRDALEADYANVNALERRFRDDNIRYYRDKGFEGQELEDVLEAHKANYQGKADPYYFRRITKEAEQPQSRTHEFPVIDGQAIGGIAAGTEPVSLPDGVRLYQFPDITDQAGEKIQPVQAMPTQSQVTNTQATPRVDTVRQAENLGLPVPAALPAEAVQPVQAMPSIVPAQIAQPVQNNQQTVQNTLPAIPQMLQGLAGNPIAIDMAQIGQAPAQGTIKPLSVNPEQDKSIQIPEKQDNQEENGPAGEQQRTYFGKVWTKYGEQNVYTEKGLVYLDGDPSRGYKPMDALKQVKQIEAAIGKNDQGNQHLVDTLRKAAKSLIETPSQVKAPKESRPLEHWTRDELLAELTGNDRKIYRRSSKSELVEAVRRWQERRAGETPVENHDQDNRNPFGIPQERITEIEREFTREESKKILAALADRDLPNIIEGITAQVNRQQRDKLTSGKAVTKSVENGSTPGEHYALAGQIAETWRYAAEAQRRPDEKNDKPDVEIECYVAPVIVKDQPKFAWLTVKKTPQGRRLYSVELLNEEKLRLYTNSRAENNRDYSARSFEEIIEALKGPVKEVDSNNLTEEKPLEQRSRDYLLGMLTEGELKANRGKTKQEIAEFIRARQETTKDEAAEEDEYRKALPLVASVDSGVIHKTDGMSAIEAAENWIRLYAEGVVKTEIGDVEIGPRQIRDSLSHGFSVPKLDAVQAIAPVLEKGSYLGEQPDKDGKPIRNYYFAGRVNISGDEKIVFVRTRKAAGGNNRFYVHEVFTEVDIKKTANARGVTDQDRPFQGAADFYKNLIANYADVKAGQNNQEAAKPKTHLNKPVNLFDPDKIVNWDRLNSLTKEELDAVSEIFDKNNKQQPQEASGKAQEPQETADYLDGHPRDMFGKIRNKLSELGWYYDKEDNLTKKDVGGRKITKWNPDGSRIAKIQLYNKSYIDVIINDQQIFNTDLFFRIGKSSSELAKKIDDTLTQWAIDNAEDPGTLKVEPSQQNSSEQKINAADGQYNAETANGKVSNPYDIPQERVTKIEGNITADDTLRELINLAGKDLPNVIENETAQINAAQRGKLLSAAARTKSMENGFTGKEHNAGVAKIADLWKWAVLAQRNDDIKNGKPDVKIRRYVSSAKVNGQDAFGWITVKESQDGLRTYSLELVKKEQLRVKLGSNVQDDSDNPHRSFDQIIEALKGPVKEVSARESKTDADTQKYTSKSGTSKIDLSGGQKLTIEDGKITLHNYQPDGHKITFEAEEAIAETLNKDRPLIQDSKTRHEHYEKIINAAETILGGKEKNKMAIIDEKPLANWSREALLNALEGEQQKRFHKRDTKPKLVEAVQRQRKNNERYYLGVNEDGNEVFYNGHGARIYQRERGAIEVQPILIDVNGMRLETAQELYKNNREFLTTRELARMEKGKTGAPDSASQTEASDLTSSNNKEEKDGISGNEKSAERSVVESKSNLVHGHQAEPGLGVVDNGQGKIAGNAGSSQRMGDKHGNKVERTEQSDGRSDQGDNRKQSDSTLGRGMDDRSQEDVGNGRDAGRGLQERDGRRVGDGSSLGSTIESRTRDKEANSKVGGKSSRQDSKSENGRLGGSARNSNNHRIADDDVIVAGGNVARAKANVAAIELLRKLEKEKRPATDEEKKILSRFSGWGSLAEEVFKRDFECMIERDKDGLELKQWYGSELADKYDKWKKNYGAKLHPKLGGLLSKEEWDAAKASTLNAHYTDRAVIKAIWKMLERFGFKGGNILEPSAGVGLFFGLMPEKISSKSNLNGVELDTITGGILKLLYPDARIQVTGFEKSTGIADNSQDLVISNVPFGNFSVHDSKRKEYSKLSIHNYFISRAIDALKPGGIAALITTHHTFDSGNSKLRNTWFDKADLIGAMRLPSGAFAKNAGTAVTTDILFFRKKSAKSYAGGQPFINLATIDIDGKPAMINEYFVKNPEMALGEHSLQGSMYSGEDEYALMPREGVDLEKALNDTIELLPEKVFGSDGELSAQADIVEGVKARSGSYTRVDGVIGSYNQIDKNTGDFVPLNNVKNMGQLNSYMDVKEAVQKLIEQMQIEKDDRALAPLREKLNDVYDEYVKKYGPLNEKTPDFILEDIEYPTVLGLENMVETEDEYTVKSGPKKGQKQSRKIKKYVKADIFNRRTLWPLEKPFTAANVIDAAKISSFYENRLDLDYIGALLGIDAEAAKELLLKEGVAFENPETGLMEEKNEYLSGNVVEKLKKAKEAAKDNIKYEGNIKALEKVQPVPFTIDDISVQIGSSWIPAHFYESFLESLGVKWPRVTKSTRVGEEINEKWSVTGSVSSESLKWGTTRANIIKIMEDCLNLKKTQILDKETDGSSQKNQEATDAAQAKQEELQRAFGEWANSGVMDGEKVSKKLTEIYNEKFNHTVVRKFEVPDIKYFPGANRNFELRDHQKRGVMRALTQSCLLAHAVGSGKTMLLSTLAMEMRRLGTAKKPLIVVQGSTIGQFASQFKQLYPLANILAPAEKERSAKERQKLLSQIALGDYDAIIVPHSFFDRLSVSPELEKNFINQQIELYKEQIVESKSDKARVKDIEKAIKRLETRLAKLADSKKDQHIYWDQLGIDALLIDEAHNYKRGMFLTKMANVKGLDKDSSMRSYQLLLKSQLVREKTGGKNVILATGTPVSNTITEMWTMFRYIRPDLLERYGITAFDDFATLFATTTVKQEITATGEFKPVERFDKFINLKALSNLWLSGADVALAEDLKIKGIPKIRGDKVTPIICKFTQAIKRLIAWIKKTYDDWMRLPAKERFDQPHVPLVCYGNGRKAPIDMRLINAVNVGSEDGKSGEVAKRAFKIWKDNKQDSASQIIFCDLFQSPDKTFNLFDDIRKKLVKYGVPKDEIALIHDYKSDDARAKMFEKVNSGEVRILMGTTTQLGVGVNVQNRLLAAHHLDAPQRPSDFEQRNGRILRPGNKHKEVDIFVYCTENTLDALSYQVLVTKQKFINQLLRGKIEDAYIDNPFDATQESLELMQAAASGNPLVREKMELGAVLRNLRNQESADRTEKRNTAFDIDNLTSRVSRLENELPVLRKVNDIINKNYDHGKLRNRKEFFNQVKEFIDPVAKRIMADAANLSENERFSQNKLDKLAVSKKFDLPGGFEITAILKPAVSRTFESGNVIQKHDLVSRYVLAGNGIREGSEFNGAQGLVTRLENMLQELAGRSSVYEQKISEDKKAIDVLSEKISKPFAKAKELAEKEKRLAEVEKELADLPPDKTFDLDYAGPRLATMTQEDLEAMDEEARTKLIENEKFVALPDGTAVNGFGEYANASSLREDQLLSSIAPGQFLTKKKEGNLKIRALEAVTRKFRSICKNAAPVESVQSFTELPEHIRAIYQKVSDSLEGVYDPATKKVWLVADNISDTSRAVEVWAHEQIVHHGLRGMLSDAERKRVLNQLWLSLGGMGNNLIKNIADIYGLKPRVNEADRMTVMEETLANLAERKKMGLLDAQEQSFWQKVVRAIQNVWNALVERVTGNKARMGMEQVDELLSALGKYVINGIPGSNIAQTGRVLASVGNESGKTNSYGVPIERVVRIEKPFTREEAREALKAIAGMDLPNKLEGITAQVNRNQRDKLVSGVAIGKSKDNEFTSGSHLNLAAQIAKAWEYAASARREFDRNDTSDVKFRKYVAAIEVGGHDAFTWLTIGESDSGLRIYSAELLNEEKLRQYAGTTIILITPTLSGALMKLCNVSQLQSRRNRNLAKILLLHSTGARYSI